VLHLQAPAGNYSEELKNEEMNKLMNDEEARSGLI
jgi:hypothetical protein